MALKLSIPKRRRGMPDFVPTERDRTFVRMATAAGITQEDMLKCIINPRTENPISLETLLKHFRRELDSSFEEANAKVVASLFKSATSGDTTAAIWWTKTRMRWSAPAQQMEHTGPGGGPIQTEDLGMLSPIEREQTSSPPRREKST